MKNPTSLTTPRLVVTGLLAAATFVAVERKSLAADPPVDPAHAAHVAAGAMPPDAAKGDPALSQQISQLQTKLAKLEAALAKNAPQASAAVSAAAAMPGMAAPAEPMAGMKSAAPAPMAGGGMVGMGGMAAPPGGSTSKMAMMDKMMGMMDKMMSMDNGPMPAAAPMAGGGGMGMRMMQKEMSGMGSAPMPASAAAAGMSGGGGMGMDKMEMAGMMGMGTMSGGAAGTMPQSVLPGFPGASHLYHIGATDFFLDHPQHIALTTEQLAALNKAKEQALLTKSSANRAIEQADQELWTLTASDQPDAAKIQAKISEIEKLRGDERLSFIRAVGDASKLLTEEQRKSLTGFAPPAPAMSAPAPTMPPAAMPMKDM